MDWIQLIVLIISFAGIFLWARSETKQEIAKIENMIKDSERNTQNMIKDSERNTQNLIIAIKDEMKDFHGRLCAIEERREK